MATVETLPKEQRFVMSGVPWGTYDRLLHEFEGRHLRLTYREGDLEIMTLSPEHERAKKILARLLEAFTEELNLPILGLGSTTFRQHSLARGLEPDECWYIEHEEVMRQKREIDLNIDPPPDLVVEGEISRSVLDRMDIYQTLGVPEVWRFDGQTLRICGLENQGYRARSRSLSLPQLPTEQFVHFLNQREHVSETELVRSFRQWVRDNLAG